MGLPWDPARLNLQAPHLGFCANRLEASGYGFWTHGTEEAIAWHSKSKVMELFVMLNLIDLYIGLPDYS